MTVFSKMKPAEKFASKWKEHGLTGGDPIQEFEFDAVDGRKWRFDFAWPELMVAVEIDGFGFGHQAMQAMERDNEKQNAAVQQGWWVLRYNSRQLGSHAKVEAAIQQVSEILCDAVVTEEENE